MRCHALFLCFVQCVILFFFFFFLFASRNTDAHPRGVPVFLIWSRLQATAGTTAQRSTLTLRSAMLLKTSRQSWQTQRARHDLYLQQPRTAVRRRRSLLIPFTHTSFCASRQRDRTCFFSSDPLQWQQVLVTSIILYYFPNMRYCFQNLKLTVLNN